MDYLKVLVKYFKNNEWNYEETLESIDWKDTTTEKPSKERLEIILWNDLSKDEMREERNQLLKDSDHTVLPDFPTSNMKAWIDDRQQLRDNPIGWSVEMPFPTKPMRVTFIRILY